jgi:hypothetical protein|tara:strand:- start:394 stop:693 length:300 start_codon:yes stop_codon:yes gene_type:complete
MSIKDKYVYLTADKEDQTCIGIKGGKFAGVVYKYGEISIGEETDTGNMPFKFKFDILDSNGLSRAQFDTDDEWTTLIGDILVDIIDEQHEKDNKLESNN